MPYKDITYDNGFTERFYFDETEEEEALRMSRMNSVAKFPSADHRSATRQNPSKQTDQKPPSQQAEPRDVYSIYLGLLSYFAFYLAIYYE